MNEDLTGKQFGRWTVVQPAEIRSRNLKWLCRCECGTERAVFDRTLRDGTSTSCGCRAKEAAEGRIRRARGRPKKQPPEDPRALLRKQGMSYRASGASWDDVSEFLKLPVQECRELCRIIKPQDQH